MLCRGRPAQEHPSRSSPGREPGVGHFDAWPEFHRDSEPVGLASQAGELALELTSVTSGGKEYRVTTSLLRFQGRPRQTNPATGKQDDRGARIEDATRAGVGVL